MSLRSRLSIALQILAILVVFALVAGQLLGQPVLLSYTTSGSMEPTIGTGDGYVVIPAQIAGPVEEGDVMVFRAKEIQGGGLTVHRVVGETDRGYITKGDANSFTDQDGGEPPVKEPQIIGVVLQVGGSVLTIPELGTLVTGSQAILSTVQRAFAALLGTRNLLGMQGLAYLLFGATMVLYLIDIYLADDTSRERDRGRDTGTNVRLYVGLMALALVLAATAAMAGPAGTEEFTIVSAEFESDSPLIIPQGGSNSITYPVANGGLVPVVVFLEPGGEAVDIRPKEFRLGSQSVANATLTLSAPTEIGAYRRYVTEHRYLAILPQPVIRALYQTHPWAPILVIDALIGIPFYLLGVRLVGTGRVKTRSRSRDLPLLTRCRRMLRQLY